MSIVLYSKSTEKDKPNDKVEWKPETHKFFYNQSAHTVDDFKGLSTVPAINNEYVAIDNSTGYIVVAIGPKGVESFNGTKQNIKIESTVYYLVAVNNTSSDVFYTLTIIFGSVIALMIIIIAALYFSGSVVWHSNSAGFGYS